MNKKVLAIAVVAVLAVSSVGGYAFFDAVYGDHNHNRGQKFDDNGNNNNGSNGNDKRVSDLTGGYFDILGASSLSICTVDDTPATDGTSQNTAMSITSNGAAMMPTNCSIYSTGVSYEGYHNELHKTVGDGDSEKVYFYLDKTDMQGKDDPRLAGGNIVYLEKFGSLYFMAYYSHNLEDIYRNLMGEDCDFWCTDRDMDFYLVDANTGKVFSVSGIWCGCTAWRYQGTNDMISSMQYLGCYQGEEYFKVNVECNKYCTLPPEGTFRDMEGIFAFKSDGENLTYRPILVDDDAMVMEFTGDRADMSSWTQIPGKHKKYGYDMKLYENGLIRYIFNTNFPSDNQGDFSGDTYILTPAGESIQLDVWEECSGILCRSVVYDNTYFPISMEVYGSDGSVSVVNCTPEQSYQLASTNHYRGCIYRETTAESTMVYILRNNGTVDRLELRSNLEYEIDENIFGVSIPLATTGYYVIYGQNDFHTYNNEIFYEPFNWAYSRFSMNTKIMIIEDKLYAVDTGVMKEYDLSDRTINSYEIPADAIGKVRVDEYGRVFVEGFEEDRFCKLDLGDGGFQISRSSLQVMTLKRVLANEGEGS